jgi:hypothetical protein
VEFEVSETLITVEVGASPLGSFSFLTAGRFRASQRKNKNENPVGQNQDFSLKIKGGVVARWTGYPFDSKWLTASPTGCHFLSNP